MIIHNELDLIKCEICEEIFKDRRGLSSHVKSKHGIQWADYQKEHPVVDIPEDKEETKDKADEEAKASEGITEFNDRLERIEVIVNSFMKGNTMSGEPSGITDFPGEDIEVIGEKLNYKVALNPAIFSRYDKFKAVVIRRGKKWTGDFADFLDMSTKDVLAVYGIYDTVIEFRDGKILLEVPAELTGIG